MAKAKPTDIPHYEMLYIVSNKYTEDELPPIMDKVRQLINDNQGKITFSEEWGKKRLAYPIDHFRHGYYTLIEFDLEGENLANINRALRLMNEILRYQIVRKKVKSVGEIEKEKKIAEKIAAKAKKEEVEKDEKKKERKKVDLKELDEKLDKILDTDDLI
jgi:small subunit ribosomal protein S6